MKKLYVYHMLAWAVFITYEISTSYVLAGRVAPTSDYVFHYLLNMLLFYVHVANITSSLSRKQKALLTLCEIAGYIILNHAENLFLWNFMPVATRVILPMKMILVGSLYRCLYFMGISSIYGVGVNLFRSKEKVLQLEREKWQHERQDVLLQQELLQSRNAVLRAQINPHLFFNTLSFIYNAIYKVSGKAGDAVLLLADITRYSLRPSDTDGLALLRDEIAALRDLLQLNQVRFNDRLQVKFECDVDAGELKVVPLVMLTLVENVLKYGDLEDASQPAVIRLQLQDGNLCFSTRNKKLSNAASMPGTGMGLANSRMRLQHAYGDGFSLRMNETEETYYTDLVIQSDVLCLVAIS
ncbi:sensor histidine kinase [Mucilaginibacter conchicola]|uniref:sensor histidine kinase n=1 Tax=Mucilaginibacter conchicola TaxID=2303333 RepID=UPI001314FB15|nr:histidine kinase [Mucilaginibacter conchicola]